MENYNALCHYAYQYLKSVEGSEDLVQDTFMSLWSHRESLDFSRSLRPLAYKALYHRMIDYKRGKRGSSVSLETILEHPLDAMWNQVLAHRGNPADFTDESIDAKWIKKEVDDALSMLPAKCAEIYRMNREQDMTYGEIAEKLGLSAKSVEKYMTKTLAALRLRLRKSGSSLIIFYSLFLL